MPLTYACPYWSWEEKLVSHCEMAVLKFPTPEARREYTRQYCARVDGWKNCSIAKMLNEKYENEKQEHHYTKR